MFSVAITLILACTPTALLDFAVVKWQATKNMRIEDAYKWTFQATRGGEHAAPSHEAAAGWLDREWKSTGDQPADEKQWVPLCPGSDIGRFNLRPYKRMGGDPNDLVEAFVASAAQYRSEPTAFTEAWAELGRRLAKKGFGHVTHREWLRLDAEMKAKNYPAVHHSEAYKKAYSPAYRILTLEQARRLIPSL